MGVPGPGNYYTIQNGGRPTVEWAPYQSDNWQPVPLKFDGQAGATSRIKGRFVIPADFLATLPEGFCLRVNDAVWMDHRGLIPSSLTNKTEAAIDSLEWVTSGMEFGRPGSYGVLREAFRYWSYGTPVGECGEEKFTSEITVNEFGPSGNYVEIKSQVEHGGTQCASIAQVSFQSDGLGIPAILKRIPDDTEILEAWAEISCSGLARYHLYAEEGMTNCDDEVVSPSVYEEDTTVTDVDFAVLGFKTPTEFEVIGTLAGLRAGTQVKTNYGPILKAQLDARKTAKFPYGYGVVAIPSSVGGVSGDISSLLPTEGTTRTITVCPGFPCEGSSRTRYYITDIQRITWTNATISKVVARIKYSDEEKSRTLIMPRPPSVAGL